MSIRAILLPLASVLTVGLAACGGAVKSESVPAPSEAPGGAAPPSPRTPVVQAEPTNVVPESLGEPTCAAGETALVVASDEKKMVGAFAAGSSWRTPGALAPATRLVAFADPQGGLGVLSIASEGRYAQAETHDGTRFDVLPEEVCTGPRCFTPTVSGPLVALSESSVVGTTLVAGELWQWTPAYFDSDAKAWRTTGSGVYPELVQDLAAATVSGFDALVYRGFDGHLMDSIATGQGSALAPPHRHENVTVVRDAEIEMTGIAAASGRDTLGVFYRTVVNGRVALGAITNHLSSWSAPVTTPLDVSDPLLHFAATGTPGGGFVIAGITVSGHLELRSYVGGTFGPVFTLDADLSPESGLAIASGLCGDQAWLAYASATGELRTRRVRVQAVSKPKVVGQLSRAPRDGQIAIVTRAR